MSYQLVIGNKNTSSWSLRPWLAMRCGQIPFAEVSIDLRAPDKKAQILKHSPSGKVPALLVNGEVTWDSLAIIEFLAEAHPDARLWPDQRDARAMARCVSAEMHAGFQPLRDNCPMNLLACAPMDLPETVRADVRRIVELWRACRGRYGNGGPFLFGAFSGADAMYAPVASRFRTYVPALSAYGDDGTAQAYVQAIFALPYMHAWETDARAEQASAQHGSS